MSEKLFVTIDGKRREMNEAELAQWAIDLANWQEQETLKLVEKQKAEQEAQAKAEAIASAIEKLTALGLTPEEIIALKG
jgi:DNA repair ATPase RecN